MFRYAEHTTRLSKTLAPPPQRNRHSAQAISLIAGVESSASIAGLFLPWGTNWVGPQISCD
jgi:hypothetical protein